MGLVERFKLLKNKVETLENELETNKYNDSKVYACISEIKALL